MGPVVHRAACERILGVIDACASTRARARCSPAATARRRPRRRLLRRADGVRRRRPRQRARPQRDLRPRAVGAALPRRGRGRGQGQRQRLRACRPTCTRATRSRAHRVARRLEVGTVIVERLPRHVAGRAVRRRTSRAASAARAAAPASRSSSAARTSSSADPPPFGVADPRYARVHHAKTVRRGGLFAADEVAGERAGGLVVADGGLAGDDGGDVARGALHEPTAAGGEVEHHLRLADLQPLVVDHVEVGAVPGRDPAAVVQAVEIGGVGGHPPDRGGEVDARPAGAVAHPVREHERRARWRRRPRRSAHRRRRDPRPTPGARACRARRRG